MRRFGLIGYPLSHSFSEAYFSKKFKALGIDASYKAFPLKDFSELPDLILREGPFTGLNVTIPFKEMALDMVDELDKTARDIGAVNIIKFVKRGSKEILIGYNSDHFGFSESLIFYGIEGVKNALILGTGGASRAVSYALRTSGSDITLVSRDGKRGDKTYNELLDTDIEQFDLIVNTTPVGTFPSSGNFPDIPYSRLKPSTTLYDLVYNPQETLFLKKGKERGCNTINGFKMLQLQAEKGWEIWNSPTPD